MHGCLPGLLSAPTSTLKSSRHAFTCTTSRSVPVSTPFAPRPGNGFRRIPQNTKRNPNWTRRCVRWNRFSLPALVIRPLAGDLMLEFGLLK